MCIDKHLLGEVVVVTVSYLAQEGLEVIKHNLQSKSHGQVHSASHPIVLLSPLAQK